MKVVLIGGHLSPAVSVIEKLKKEEVFYIGRKYTFEGDKALSLEHREVAKMGVPFFSITTARLQRKFTRYTLFSFSKLPVGFFQSYKILMKIKPDVVLGFGGYVSIPVVLAAHFLKIPTVIHEQTLEAGFANKLLSKFAKKVCISWESSKDFFPKEKIVLTGNPIRKDIINAKSPPEARFALPLVYISGGSSGAHALNAIVENSLDKLLGKFYLIHQTGDSQKFKDYERLNNKKNRPDGPGDNNYEIRKFLSSSQAAESLSKADLVISRAGINTVTELIYLEKPALLIPLPYSQKSEQLKNAEFLKDLGLGEIIEQKHLTNELFFSTVLSMIKNVESYKLKRRVLINNSAEKLVEVLKNVSKGKKT